MPRGAGEPSGLPVDPDFGWGAGDVTPAAWIDGTVTWGAGDPTPETQIVAFFAGFNVLPDDGGELVTLVADWPRIGPYHVQLADSFTGKLHPNSERQAFVYAPLNLTGMAEVVARDDPFAVLTDVKTKIVNGGRVNEPDRFLRFLLPPLPPGLYDVLVHWGDVFENTLVINRAVQVVYRGRSAEQWAVRAILPPNYRAGAASSLVEDPLTGGLE